MAEFKEADRKQKMHSQIDSLVIRVHQNLASYLKLSKVPDQLSQQTSLSHHQTLAQDLTIKSTAENLVCDCNDLLKLTNQLKKLLLLSDYEQINQEVILTHIEQCEILENEMAKTTA
jgi:hypothetical protein